MYLGPGRQRDEATSATTASTQTKNSTKKIGSQRKFFYTRLQFQKQVVKLTHIIFARVSIVAIYVFEVLPDLPLRLNYSSPAPRPCFQITFPFLTEFLGFEKKCYGGPVFETSSLPQLPL